MPLSPDIDQYTGESSAELTLRVCCRGSLPVSFKLSQPPCCQHYLLSGCVMIISSVWVISYVHNSHTRL